MKIAHLLCASALAASAGAQSLNIDFGLAQSSFGQPSAAHGGAAGQPGFWNAVAAGQPAVLRYLDGTMATTKVVPGGNAFSNSEFANPLTSGDDEALMDDGIRIAGARGAYVLNINGLQNGAYFVYTYGLTPDAPTITAVTVSGSPDGVRTCGGTWPGAQAEGVTYTRHFRNVTNFALQVIVTPQTSGAFLNGVQVVRVSEGIEPYCFGTVAACPCGNAGALNAGCENSFGTGGGRLVASGSPIVGADTLALAATQLPAGTSALFFQGTGTLANVSFGDGLRCATGTIVRLGTEIAVGGACAYPGAGDAPVSVQGAVAAAQTRHYQTWYRNTAPFCTPAGFNLTNGVSVLWQ